MTVKYSKDMYGRKAPVFMSGFDQERTVMRWVTIISHVTGIVRAQLPVPVDMAESFAPDEEIYSVSRMLMLRVKLQIMAGCQGQELREFVRSMMGYSPELKEVMIDEVIQRSEDFEFADEDFESAALITGISKSEVQSQVVRYEASKKVNALMQPVEQEPLLSKVPQVRKPNTKPKSKAAKRTARRKR